MSASPTSATTARARAFVAVRLDRAREIGRELADLVDQPDELLATARVRFAELADPEYRAALETVIPGVGEAFGVRSPLLDAVGRPVVRALGRGSSAEAIWLAERLAGGPELEIRTLAVGATGRALDRDPERAWQLIRRLARSASCWVDVDGLASIVSRGVLAEPYRWAELEQLVYSVSRWERRLVASTIATLPHRVRPAVRGVLAGSPALALVEQLLGDDQPDVQKGLSWALREWRHVDPAGVLRLLVHETALAVETADGHRAWVVRDALPAIPASEAAALRTRLAGIRRRPGSPSTSQAAGVSSAFRAVLAPGSPEPASRARWGERWATAREAASPPVRDPARPARTAGAGAQGNAELERSRRP